MTVSALESGRQKKIEVFLVKQPRNCGSVHEVAKNAGIHWITAEKELQRMENEGRVHSENLGGLKVYFLNGEGKWREHVKLGKKNTLWLDTFISPFGDRFVRVKETKLSDGEWKPTGNIIITQDKLKEFISKISKIADNIKAVQK